MLPTEDAATIGRFCDDFQVTRRDESGLSLIVPWCESNGDGITRDRTIVAVLRGFFFPILMGHLSVSVAAPGSSITLEQGSFIQTIRNLGGPAAEEVLPLAELAEWAKTAPPGEFTPLLPPAPDERQRWSDGLVPPEVVSRIREAIARRERLAIRVPMHVRPKCEAPRRTHFDIFLEHSEQDSAKPVFIRDELIIPRVNCPRVSQMRSIVIVEDEPLATLLRDAETPAHTEWNQNTSNFKFKYTYGTGVIDFVSKCVSELLRIVNQAEQEPDPSITIDFFSIPAPPEDDEAVPARRRTARPRPGTAPGAPPTVPPAATPRRFRIDKLRGGFGIRPGQPGAPAPQFLDIRVAYDVRRGNPLRKYSQADFDIGHDPIRHDSAAIVVRTAEANRMLVEVTGADFSLDVTGFDPDRDLYVRAVVKEAADVDQAN
ncbi:MAG: hypothetical protein ACE15C_18220 [Phycisphaerae bacterium]